MIFRWCFSQQREWISLASQCHLHPLYGRFLPCGQYKIWRMSRISKECYAPSVPGILFSHKWIVARHMPGAERVFSQNYSLIE
jgi:hypothetical protein